MESPTFLGFLAKRVVPRPEGLDAPAVESICSVSECLSSAPIGRIEAWTFNAAGFYDTEAEALAVVPAEEVDEHDLFAYRILPMVFEGDPGDQAFDPRSRWRRLPAEPDLAGFELLGLDVVGWGETDFFECSPLSCNGRASEYPVNRFCLLDDRAVAVDAARRFGAEGSGVEPAAYHVVEVWRRAG